MSQHDLDVANQTFPNHRADVNLALKALGSNQSGSSAPGTTFANMLWYDTGNNILKMRNEANDAWINVINLNQSATTADASLAGVLNASGDMLYMGAAGANTRLAIGSADRVIQTDGLVPSWGQLSSGMFATGIVTADIIAPGAVTATKLADQIPTQSNQAALEAETDQDTYAPPDLIKHNPGVAKVWGYIDRSAGTPSLSSPSRNISSVTDDGAAQTIVNVDTDFSGAVYAPGANSISDTNVFAIIHTLAAGSFKVTVQSGAGADFDTTDFTCHAFGDQ